MNGGAKRAPKRRPKLYFSFRSPYSWLTVRRLRAVAPDLSAAMECFPYWDPDKGTGTALEGRGGEFHYVQMSRAKHLYMLMDTKRLAERLGITMAWPVDVDSWWELPHLGWLEARRAGREWEFYDAITEARWGRGDDICTTEVVAAAATTAGLDPDRIVAAAHDPDVREEAVGCLYQAYLDDVFGIPYLKWGRHRFWGLDRVDAFLEVWKPEPDDGAESEVWKDIPRPLVKAKRGYDTDSAGGCG